MTTRTAADRLDEAVDRALAGEAPPPGAELQPLVDLASRLSAALPPIPAGDRFRERLGARLRARGGLERGLQAVGELTRRGLSDRGRLLTAGAVSSAAVGVTVTAVAVWRTSRRHAAPARNR